MSVGRDGERWGGHGDARKLDALLCLQLDDAMRKGYRRWTALYFVIVTSIENRARGVYCIRTIALIHQSDMDAVAERSISFDLAGVWTVVGGGSVEALLFVNDRSMILTRIVLRPCECVRCCCKVLLLVFKSGKVSINPVSYEAEID